MFAPTQYLLWARRYYGQVACDLATSGMSTVSRAELGMPVSLDDPTGWARLRKAIAHYNDVPENQAMSALGTTHALFLAYASVLRPTDDVLVESPAYEPLVRLAEGLAANVIRFSREQSEGYRLDPDRIAKAFTPKTRLVVVTNLHNPSGVRATDQELREIAQFARTREAFLLVNEVYAPFDDLTDGSGVFRASARNLAPNILAVGSLTKCYGLGPERVGWVLGPEPSIEQAEHNVIASVGMLPLSHANLAAHAFEQIEPLAKRTRAHLIGKRTLVRDWFKARPHLQWTGPESGLFGLATLPEGSDITSRVERGVKEYGVLVAPASFFGVPHGVRVSWSAPLESLVLGLSKLEHVLTGAPPANT